MTPRFGPALVLAVLMAACMPVGAPIQQGPMPVPVPGPQLAVDITNGSDRSLEIRYEFTGEGSSGGGGGGVPACERVLVPFAVVDGDYEILLEGEPIHAGSVPAGLPETAWIVVRINVDADGDHEVIGPAVVPLTPEPFNRPIAACG